MTKRTSKPSFPTTTAHAVRLCLYQSTRRPKMLDRIITTSWGRVRVKGRIGQQHADVLEAICYEREAKADLEDGRIKLLVDPARVRRRSRQMGGSTLQSILDDLQQCLIEIIEPVDFSCLGHLVDHIDLATRRDGTPITRHDPLTGGDRRMWRVELGKAFCRLVAADIWIGYDPAPIAALTHGVSQSVARHVLTHKQQPRGGWHIDTLIRATAGDVGEQALRDRRRELRSDADGLRGIGILVESDRVTLEIRRGGVEQKRGSVEHKRGSVEQKRGAWSKSAGVADT